MINLPEEYEKEMRSLLGAEFEEYKKIYEQPVRQGLRFNPYKLTKPVWEEIMPFEKEEIPWVENGYYIHGGRKSCKTSLLFCRSLLPSGAQRHDACKPSGDSAV